MAEIVSNVSLDGCRADTGDPSSQPFKDPREVITMAASDIADLAGLLSRALADASPGLLHG